MREAHVPFRDSKLTYILQPSSTGKKIDHRALEGEKEERQRVMMQANDEDHEDDDDDT